MQIRPYTTSDRAAVLDLTLRTWAPVFPEMRAATPPFVYNNFYPHGWEKRQTEDIGAVLDDDENQVRVAETDGRVVGFVVVRVHPEDRMGEIHVLAVDPDHQRRGIGTALMNEACSLVRAAGMDMIMVETGGDPGHAPSRATYEAFGFDRWPVARYFKKL